VIEFLVRGRGQRYQQDQQKNGGRTERGCSWMFKQLHDNSFHVEQGVILRKHNFEHSDRRSHCLHYTLFCKRFCRYAKFSSSRGRNPALLSVDDFGAPGHLDHPEPSNGRLA
jgi:hypothetical protein